MWKRLFGKPPIRVWIIKQVDRGLLHLCGEGELSPGGKRERQAALEALAQGAYRGPVTMLDTGQVLNARLFAALVPHEDLTLGADGHAHWQGHAWRVSRVPQRCWTYEGPLVARSMAQGDFDLVSSEDVSGIRRRAAADAPPTRPSDLQFGAADELEGEAEFAERWRRRQSEHQHGDG